MANTPASRNEPRIIRLMDSLLFLRLDRGAVSSARLLSGNTLAPKRFLDFANRPPMAKKLTTPAQFACSIPRERTITDARKRIFFNGPEHDRYVRVGLACRESADHHLLLRQWAAKLLPGKHQQRGYPHGASAQRRALHPGLQLGL